MEHEISLRQPPLDPASIFVRSLILSYRPLGPCLLQEKLAAGEKGVYCRCWKSGTFPKCDGAHVKHNEACVSAPSW